jgi:hypothetical protein
MTATAVTYRTGTSRSALRTVLVDDVRRSVVLLPAGRLDVLMAKLIHGTTCRKESFWDEVLGQDHGDDAFVIPASQIVAKREMAIGARVIRHK